MTKGNVPDHLKSVFNAEKNDLTPEVLKNLAWLGIEHMIPIGGDDTLSYGVRLHKEGVRVVGHPKDYGQRCAGHGLLYWLQHLHFAHDSDDQRAAYFGRFSRALMVLEVFGRYAGFTAMLPTLAGAGNRCVIPEHKFDIEKLTELMVADRNQNPSRTPLCGIRRRHVRRRRDGFPERDCRRLWP